MAASRPCNLLLVDDDADQAVLMSYILKRDGHSVTIVNCARAALEALGQGRFDLLISDARMPDIGGRELIATIHSHQQEEHQELTPAILISASEDPFEEAEPPTALTRILPKADFTKRVATVIGELVPKR